MPAHLRTPADSIPLWVLVIFALLLIPPAVSAEVLTDEGSNYAIFDLGSIQSNGDETISEFKIYRIQDWSGLYFLYLKTSHITNPAVLTANPYYSSNVTLKIGSNVVGSGTAYYNALFNSAGTVIGVQVWLEIDEWHPVGYTGTQRVTITPESGTLFNGLRLWRANVKPVSATNPIGFHSTEPYYQFLYKGMHMARSHYYWENIIDISDEFVSLTRQLDGKQYASTLQITSDAGYLQDSSHNDIEVPYIGTGTWNVTNPYGRIYSGILGPDTPDTPNANTTVTIYVRSSQTGALLAGAHLLLEGAPGVDGWSDYYNGTLPSGSAEFSLPTTTEATPYQFRVTATYPGYTEVTPLQYFNTFRPRNVIIEMEPAAVAPTDPENTFLVFYVRDTSANPLPGAVIEVDDQWLYTNNNGYARFEVLKNATYPYKVSKSGYMTIQGSANVESEGSYTVNVVLGQGTVPTNTPTPTLPGATPTPDHRTNEQKGQAVIDMIADNAEGIGALALICLLMGLLKLLAKW